MGGSVRGADAEGTGLPYGCLVDGGSVEGGDWRRPDWPGPPWQRPEWRRPDRTYRGPRLFLPVLLGAIQVIGTSLAARRGGNPADLDALGYVLLLVGPAALLLRRRYPLAVYAVNVAATVLYLIFDYQEGPFFLATVAALFGAAKRSPRDRVWAVTAVGWLAFASYAALTAGPSQLIIGERGLADVTLGEFLTVTAWSAVAVVLAQANRRRGEYFAEMAKSQAEAARARQEQGRRQASDERLRIARELHDVLGHHLSLINVRAGVALHLLDNQPEQAREALDAIKVASSEALREVRGVLAALNPQDESAPRSPAPGLAEVDRLVDDARAAGLAVRLERSGDGEVPGEVGRAAYRIVQEALTNVRRHAGAAATVQVQLDRADDALTVRVDDTGSGPAGSTSDGNGIPGMRERAFALGGTLDAGARPGGGFRVVARLPIERPATGRQEADA